MFDKGDDSGSMIPEGINIHGSIDGTGHLRIEGFVKGDVKLKGHLEVGTTGRVEGELQAEDVVVTGQVYGNIYTRNKLLLRSSSRVLGNLACNALTIEEGAHLTGRCDMRQGGRAAQEQAKPSNSINEKTPATPQRPHDASAAANRPGSEDVRTAAGAQLKSNVG